MINIIYAYPSEVKALRELIKINGLHSCVSFFKWPSLPKKINSVMLNVGFAGSLNTGLALGQVVLIKKIFYESDKKTVILNSSDQSLAENFAKNQELSSVTLLTVKNPVADTSLRDKLRQKTNADVVDMEGHHIFAIAKEKNIPFISFKIITDNANSDTWQSVMQNSDKWSRILGEEVFEFIKWLIANHKYPPLDSSLPLRGRGKINASPILGESRRGNSSESQ